MKIVEQYTSPDGLLKFIVVDYGNDIALGSDGLPWHTHPECLAPYDSVDWQSKVRKLVEDLLADRLVIQLLRKDGCLTDAFITEAPVADKYLQPGEQYELRYWSGRKYNQP